MMNLLCVRDFGLNYRIEFKVAVLQLAWVGFELGWKKKLAVAWPGHDEDGFFLITEQTQFDKDTAWGRVH
jgi:hypothetical protein